VKTVRETLDALEADVRAAHPQRATVVHVAGHVRFDVSYEPDLAKVFWRVNGRNVSRETASHALEQARAKSLVPFVR
jgi:hypothetical protein